MFLLQQLLGRQLIRRRLHYPSADALSTSAVLARPRRLYDTPY
jgi:hypothetical protein